MLGARLKSAGFDPNALGAHAPLWLYGLAEAEGTEQGQRLGELGSHIVQRISPRLATLRRSLGALRGRGRAAGLGSERSHRPQPPYSMPELIAYLQANAVADGHPVRLFSR